MGSVGLTCVRSSAIGQQILNGYDFSWTLEYSEIRIRRFELWASISNYDVQQVLQNGQSMRQLLKCLEKEGLVNLQEVQPLFSERNKRYSYILCLSLEEDTMKLLCKYKGQLLEVEDNYCKIVPLEKYFKKAEQGEKMIDLLKDREKMQWAAYLNALSKCEQDKLLLPGGKFIQEKCRALKKGNEM